MKTYSYISYLLVSLSIMIVKAAETPSSSQETSAVKVISDEPKQSPLRINEFKENPRVFFIKFMKTLYHKKGVGTPYLFELASKQFESLLEPSTEFTGFFQKKNIKRIKSYKDLLFEIIDVNYKWKELYDLLANINDEAEFEHKKEHIKAFYDVHEAVFSNIMEQILCLAKA